MANFQVYKVTALPVSPVADALYLVKGVSDTNAKLYATTTAGVAVEVFDDALVASMISDAISSATNLAINYVADIAARDALTIAANAMVYVADATGDNTVTSGGALYFYNSATDAFVKVAEYESMDVVLDWDNIQNKPTSTVSQIDQAVTDSHTHSNKSTLDLISATGGFLYYDGSKVDTVTAWGETSW